MADEYSGADMVRVYQTGAGSSGGAQSDASLSLGGYVSGNEVGSLGYRRLSPVSGLRIDYVSGLNGVGLGSLRVLDEDEVAWTPPGGTAGATVTILNGETKVCYGGGADADKYVRVTRTSATALTGAEILQLLDGYKTLVGGSDFTSAEALAGEDKWRAAGAKNHGGAAVTDVKVWLEPLGTKVESPTTSLGASGSGTIGKVGGFVGWRAKGLAEVRESDGTLREVVYYSIRTDDALTVEVSGRGLLGTSAAAGAGTDVVRHIPQCRVSVETPSADAIQSVADETTDPTGLTLVTGSESGLGATHASLASGSWLGVWVDQLVIPGEFADGRRDAAVNLSWVSGGVTYRKQERGLNRVANDALKVDELYVVAGRDPKPDSDAAVASGAWGASLAYTPVAAGATYHCARLRRNEWNILDELDEDAIDRLRVNDGGTVEDAAPNGADNVTVKAAAAGAVQVIGSYFTVREGTTPAARLAKRGTHWLVHHTADGSDPSGAAATVVAMEHPDSDKATEILSWTSSGALDGATHKVRVGVRRDEGGGVTVDSDLSAIYTVTATTLGPARPRGLVFFGRAAGEHQAGQAAPTGTLDIDAGNGIYWQYEPDGISLYVTVGGVATLVWRWRWAPNPVLYVPNTWTRQSTAVSGSGTATALETVSWTAGDKRVAVCVNSSRLMMIDVTNLKLQTVTWSTVAIGGTTTAQVPAFARASETLFQGWDTGTELMRTYMRVDTSGKVTIAGHVNNLLDQTAIEAL